MVREVGGECSQVSATMTERPERMRAGQLAALPTVAEIRMAYPLAGGGATLRLMTVEGSTTERHMIPLTERGGAGRGRSGEPHPAGIYLDAITATAERLAHIDRAYGPVAELPDLPAGVSAHPSGPRSWRICIQP
ncbi:MULTISPECIES: hypothetical protein [unclassified Streptomyces]|uniref:hypothetical protein n=1 Tax=unclassified Streptomyces TaxID=2593676 RepID=UPI002E2C903F|nr:hypothetical protein [Streptomyces sp. NBC_01439]